MTEIRFNGEKIDNYFEGKNSENDASYVDEVFCDDNYEKELKHILRLKWYKILDDNDEIDKNPEHILYRIHYGINTNSLKSKESLSTLFKWFNRIAAVIVLPLAIYFGITVSKTLNNENISWVEIKAPAWTRAEFSLPDGTTGYLNSNSSLKYSGDFYKDRKVTINGEAFFDVFKDSKRPFKVLTNDVTVEVLGTRFNIASYENEKNVEVVLEEGELIFNNIEMTKSYIMNPSDLVVYDKSLKKLSTEVVDPLKYTSWKEGKLIFRNDPVDVIVRKLERWYNIDVDIKGNDSDGLRLRATFADENLEEVLYFLKRSLPLDYKIKEGGLNNDDIYGKKEVSIILKNR